MTKSLDDIRQELRDDLDEIVERANQGIDQSIRGMNHMFGSMSSLRIMRELDKHGWKGQYRTVKIEPEDLLWGIPMSEVDDVSASL
ncbi:hypothetical protein RPALISO_173 [Ruegeria phage RpAliso]|nr:hypothetical protein RPALISO_173 [Ruegeria phage RpAliso]